MLLAIPGPGDLSLSSRTVATNLSLMGLTIIALLLSAELFNATLSQHRQEFEDVLSRLASGLGAPIGGISSVAGGVVSRVPFIATWGGPIGVLTLTAVIYGLAEPDFGFNKHSIIVALSVLLCVCATTYVSEGGEAFVARFRYGQSAGLKAFPFAVAIAAASVTFSKLAGLEPAIIYGFVGTAVFLRPSTMSTEEAGKAAFAPALALLGVSLAAWFLVIPLRSFNTHSDATLPLLMESVSAGIFIVGLQSLFFNLIPLSFMDGEKIWRWNKGVWLALMSVAALLFWYVFLNKSGDFGTVFDDTASIAVLSSLGLVVMLSFTVWGFFRVRDARTA